MTCASLPIAPADPGESARALLAALGDPAWIVDARTACVVAGNAAAERLLGRPLTGLRAGEVLDTLEDAAYWESAAGGRLDVLESDCTLYPADGRVCHLTRRIAPLADPAGRMLCLVHARDRGFEQRMLLERETALAELRATLEATADAILVTDLDGRIRAFNRRFSSMWALPDSALQSQDDRAVRDWLRMNVMDVDAYDRRLEQVQARTLAESVDRIALVNGALLERHAQPQWSQGRPIGRVFSFRELNPRRAGAPREVGAHGIDQLTNLPNRTGFLQAIEAAMLPGACADGFAVLTLEFDRDALFGEGGDSKAGARRLCELAGQVRGAMRQRHHCARLGGSRFGVLIEHAGEAAAEAAGRRLIDAQERGRGVRVAIGFGTYPGAGLSADEILRHVEIAMYRAQQEARSAISAHRFGFESRQRRRDRLEAGLYRAVAEGHLRLAAQPRFDAAAERRDAPPCALEMSLRWRDRELGEISPAQFLSVARERGLIGALDDWVLEHGLFQARRWREAGHALRLNVDVSDWQLTQPGYARRVGAALEAASWPADALELDIDESALQTDPDAAIAAIRALARQGVRVVLQTFGDGPASLAWLRRLPLSAVKLATGISQGAPGTGAQTRWLPALAALAHALGVAVFAEGVDSELQRLALQRAGCDGLQGRHFGAWMEERALDAWLSARTARVG